MYLYQWLIVPHILLAIDISYDFYKLLIIIISFNINENF